MGRIAELRSSRRCVISCTAEICMVAPSEGAGTKRCHLPAAAPRGPGARRWSGGVRPWSAGARQPRYIHTLIDDTMKCMYAALPVFNRAIYDSSFHFRIRASFGGACMI